MKKKGNRTLPLAVRRQMAVARRAARSKPVDVVRRITVIPTNKTWVNAMEISRNPAWIDLSPAKYVWGQNDPTGSAAVVAKSFRLFRGSLRRITSATLKLSVDNYAIVLVNGFPVLIDEPNANTSNFTSGRTFNIRPFLRLGRNDVVIAGFNYPPGSLRSSSNPAGIAALIRIAMR